MHYVGARQDKAALQTWGSEHCRQIYASKPVWQLSTETAESARCVVECSCTRQMLMDYQDLAVDRIHYLVDRAIDLYQSNLDAEAELLMAQAMDIAEDIRNSSQAAVA